MTKPDQDTIDHKVARRLTKGGINATVGPCMHCGQDIPVGDGFQGTRGGATLFEHVKITTASAQYCATTNGELVAEAKLVRGVPDSNGFLDTRPRRGVSTKLMTGAAEMSRMRSEHNL